MNLRRLGATAGLIVLAALLAVPVTPATPAAAGVTTSAWQQTKEIQRGDQGPLTATLKVNNTTDLINRQVLRLSWSGLLASHHVVTPLPAQNQSVASKIEYPVVILQCSKPNPAKQDCYFNRGLPQEQGDFSAWDALQPPDQQAYGYVQPFQAVNRSEPYSMLPTFTPPDFGTDGFGGTVAVEPTDADGTRSDVRFEVRDGITMPSLGCSSSRDCSLVVIPVMDLACAGTAGSQCREGALGPVGELGNGTDIYNRSIAAGSWSFESNWRNRFVVPITFAPVYGACAVTDTRAQRAIVGAETADMAFRSWGRKMCLDPAAPKIAHIRQGEGVARVQLTAQGGSAYAADAALITRPVTESPRPVAHAPVLATGFAVAYAVDVNIRDDGLATTPPPPRPYEYQHLRLNQRLLAKLLTQSYRGNFDRAKNHPDIGRNPASVFWDPEFLALNPDYPQLVGGAPINQNDYPVETLDVITNDSDAYYELTRYVATDPTAAKWLDGEPDPWGTVVNPLWRGKQLPIGQFELRDQWVGPISSETKCPAMPSLSVAQNTSPSLEQAVYSIVDSQQTLQACQHNDQTGEYLWNKPPRRYFPMRNFLAITSTAYADAYGLQTAQLQSGTDGAGKPVFAAATPSAMARALSATELDEATGTRRLDHANLPADAYPGTMLVYLAVPTSGLPADEAKSYADVIRRAVSPAYQTLGTGVGQLPDGYASLPESLREQARTVADQLTAPPTSPAAPPAADQTTPDDGAGATPSASSDTPDPGTSPKLPGSARPSTSGGAPVPRSLTHGDRSALGTWALPVLFGVGLLTLLTVPLLLLAAQPDHPLRRFFLAVAGRLRRRAY